jgi:SsrA-binding protein
MVKERGRNIIAQNRKARYDYHIEDTLEAGLVLTGTEVKSLRAGRASLVDGYAEIVDGEAWLHNAHIPEYTQGTWNNHTPRRKRKLLLHRHEIDKIERRVNERGLTLVPLSMYFKDGRAKVEIALAKGKKSYDKRQAIATRDAQREATREFGRQAKGATATPWRPVGISAAGWRLYRVACGWPATYWSTTEEGLNGFDFGRWNQEKRAEDPGLSR